MQFGESGSGSWIIDRRCGDLGPCARHFKLLFAFIYGGFELQQAQSLPFCFFLSGCECSLSLALQLGDEAVSFGQFLLQFIGRTLCFGRGSSLVVDGLQFILQGTQSRFQCGRINDLCRCLFGYAGVREKVPLGAVDKNDDCGAVVRDIEVGLSVQVDDDAGKRGIAVLKRCDLHAVDDPILDRVRQRGGRWRGACDIDKDALG